MVTTSERRSEPAAPVREVSEEGVTARPCEARVDLVALRANLDEARRLAGDREVIAVVKADAYGHGAIPVARALADAGCGRLAVLTAPEAVALRDAGVGLPILVLAGARDDEEASDAVSHGLTPVVHHESSLERVAAAAAAAGRRTTVHVEVDTGMRRMGVPAEAAAGLLARAARHASLDLEGVFTHYACADEPDLAPSLAQAERFRAVLRDAAALGVRPRLVHADNSAALMAGSLLADALPEANAVRPGLMLYGVRPAAHLEGALAPVMSFLASVLAVRVAGPGDAVGYGGTWRAPKSGTRIATLAVGYADGVPWTAANRGAVWLAGGLRPIVGRISMDSIGVDVGRDVDVQVGDEAVILGTARDGSNGVPVEDAADAAGTLSYELLVRVGARVPRVTVG